jgi:hypothetical protein
MTSHFVTLQDRKRANLAKVAKHDAYLVHEEANGTLVWEPAGVITEAERRLLQQSDIVDEIAANRENPTRMRSRDRSSSPRA